MSINYYTDESFTNDEKVTSIMENLF